MKIRPTHLVPLALAIVVALPASLGSAATNDREYKMGEDDGVAITPGVTTVHNINGTFDSAGLTGMDQLVDLIPSGGPVYQSIVGRPDGVGGFGVEFNAASSQFLRNFSLGLPQTTWSAIGGSHTGTLNYNGIVNRGMQFWVKPDVATVQTLVMDTNQQGVRINSSGNFSMRYRNVDFNSTLAATPGNWYHVMVVTDVSLGTRMYVDGIAVAAATGVYSLSDTSPLVVGANTGGDENNFGGGTEEFFDGIIDDLTLFVMGENAAVSYGGLNFATDNGYANYWLSGEPGDIDNSGALGPADKADFISGWLSEKRVNGVRVGDLSTFAAGDLNFDGITDIFDLALMQNALTMAGFSAITAAELQGVPEPSSLILLLFGGAALSRRRRSAS